MASQTLSELQKYFHHKAIERGFDKETAQDTLLLMTEELGELAKAIRKTVGIKTEDTGKKYDLEGELADVQIYLLHLANILNIDLEQAFWKKEEKNNQRTWT